MSDDSARPSETTAPESATAAVIDAARRGEVDREQRPEDEPEVAPTGSVDERGRHAVGGI